MHTDTELSRMEREVAVRRLRLLTFGDWLVAVAGACLLLSMFLPWFRQVSSGGLTGKGDPNSPPANLDAWQTFGPLALVLLAAAVVSLGTAGRRLWREARFVAPAAATAAGVMAGLFVVAGTVLNVGEFGLEGPDSFYTISSVRQGVLAAVLSASAMTIGGLLGLQPQHRGVAGEVEHELGQKAHQHGESQ